MGKQFNRSLFIFRRDLRLRDNSGLISALEQSHGVLPCFILDPRQLGENSYRSDNAVQFMFESLEQTDRDLRQSGGRLYLFEGISHEVVGRLLSAQNLDAVFVNRDYTPFSVQRDARIRETCDQHGAAFIQYADALLTEPEAVLKDDGNPYTIYTPFAKRARTLLVDTPRQNSHRNYLTEEVPSEPIDSLNKYLPSRNEQLFTRGGSNAAHAILEQVGSFRDYATTRDLPALQSTTGLSAHLKFGTASIREVYHAVVGTFGESHTLINELYWRDFFTHIAAHFPHVFRGAFYPKYDALKWSEDPAAFDRWKTGTTGFPIVDAGMRQLNVTGYMHNRVRMIVASFLTKDLHISWRWGEQYFAQRLTDYDPSVNNGNWQWAASTGCDAAPYFRIFNPWLQQKKFDPDCVYIQRWTPELRAISPATIHTQHASNDFPPGYPRPMLDHRVEAENTKRLFASLQSEQKGSV